MTIFACSDIHSAYEPWMDALKKAGFNEDNPEHIIVLCGDAFDRLDESEKVFLFIMRMVEKGRIILIRGNHDILLEELCMRGFPYSHDKHNGTVKTVWHLGGSQEFDECCRNTWNRLARYRELLVNYFETKNYIFVHSWIPTNVEFEGESKPWYQQGKTLTWMEDWRNANDVEWEEAMWGNPFVKASQDLNKTGKIICVGHWHCSVGWANEEGRSEFGEDAKWDIYKDEKHNVIFLDRCTAHTGEVNVLVLEDEFLE